MPEEHEKFMKRCIQIAKLGCGSVAPNPMVGSIIVLNNKIIAEGYHEKFGEAHAEVNAINKVNDKSVLSQATIYISLEPCAHFGKTPPCVNLITKYNFKHVVIGCLDTFSAVNGLGVKILKSAGIKVTIDVLKDECIELNKRFFCSNNLKRPYVILKWAQTDNGIIGSSTQGNVAISNQESKSLSHLWRSQEQAILIGVNTANIDNPKLNVRNIYGKKPIRFIIDLNNNLKENLSILNDNEDVYVFTLLPKKNQKRIKYLKVNNSENVVREIVSHLHRMQINSLIIEGGAYTLQSFINENCWNEAWILVTNKNLKANVKAPVLLNHKLIGERLIVSVSEAKNILKLYSNESANIQIK